MRKLAFLGIAIVAAALMSTALATAQGPVRDDMLVTDTGDIRGPGCSTTMNAPGMITMSTSDSTPLYNHTSRAGLGVFPTCNPILAPDGHQVTWGEFKAAQGSATIKCINTGTHTALHFSGLLPKGTYSAWVFVVNPNAPPPFLAGGTLGRTALSENVFTASAAGEGQISRTTPEEALSVFGNIGSCFLDSPAQIHLVYHSDGQTHGMVPGPSDTWVVNARFFLP
jgi:hypothetical protein